METKVIATKFVRQDVPELETLKFSMVYLLREKLNKGEKLNLIDVREQWEFDEHGLMRRREASINDVPIKAADRKFHWPRPVAV